MLKQAIFPAAQPDPLSVQALLHSGIEIPAEEGFRGQGCGAVAASCGADRWLCLCAKRGGVAPRHADAQDCDAIFGLGFDEDGRGIVGNATTVY